MRMLLRSDYVDMRLGRPMCVPFFFFLSRRRHTRCLSDWSSDVCSSDLRPVFTRHFLPGRLALMGAKADLAVLDRRRQEDAPAIFRHADKAELGPALRLDADRGAQIDELLLKALRAAVAPPIEIAGMPALQRRAPPAR